MLLFFVNITVEVERERSKTPSVSGKSECNACVHVVVVCCNCCIGGRWKVSAGMSHPVCRILCCVQNVCVCETNNRGATRPSC